MARTTTKPKKTKPPKTQTALTTQKQATASTDESKLYERVRTILDEARQRCTRSINSEMVQAYWLIGQAIVEHEQKGKHRAEYGEQVIDSLSRRLAAEFGRGFGQRNLAWMRELYIKFPILHALRAELSWTHYRLLLKVENSNAREFYESEAAKKQLRLPNDWLPVR